MKKIEMKNPIVEIDGDEMTRVIWQQIKDIVLKPFVDINTEYFDLQLKKREETGDRITVDCAMAVKKHKVAVKCATITPNAQRVEEYNLSEMWKSPNGTIRAILDGTVFRTPIFADCIRSYIPSWKKPITVARHAYGDLYKNCEMRIEGQAKAELSVTYPDGKIEKKLIHDFEGPGILMGIHNIDSSIYNYARACFEYALELKQDLMFATKDTISKTYHHHFKDVFEEVYEKEYKEKFEENKIEYFYTLIDDAVARIMRSEGGLIWACKNYDGDVMSDMVASAAGSLAMMTSVLVSPDGAFEYEAAHGTVTRHYYRYLKGEKTSTNPVATLFAWSGALKKRGEFDGNDDLVKFGDLMEKATLDTIESGNITGDLKSLCTLEKITVLNTEDFLSEIALRIKAEITDG